MRTLPTIQHGRPIQVAGAACFLIAPCPWDLRKLIGEVWQASKVVAGVFISWSKDTVVDVTKPNPGSGVDGACPTALRCPTVLLRQFSWQRRPGPTSVLAVLLVCGGVLTVERLRLHSGNAAANVDAAVARSRGSLCRFPRRGLLPPRSPNPKRTRC